MAMSPEDLRAVMGPVQAANTPPPTPAPASPPGIPTSALNPGAPPAPSLPTGTPGPVTQATTAQPVPGQTATRLDPSGVRSSVFSQAGAPTGQPTGPEVNPTLQNRVSQIASEPTTINPNARAALEQTSRAPDAATRARVAGSEFRASAGPAPRPYPNFTMPEAPPAGAEPRVPTGINPGAPASPAAPAAGPIQRAGSAMRSVGQAAGGVAKAFGTVAGIGNAIRGGDMLFNQSELPTKIEGAARMAVGALPVIPGLQGPGVAANLALQAADTTGLTGAARKAVANWLGYTVDESGKFQKPGATKLSDLITGGATPGQSAPQAALPVPAARAAGVPAHLARGYGTPSHILDGLARVESSNGKNNFNPTSNALGPYQFLPGTIDMLHKQGFQFNPMDLNQSRAAADYYLAQLAAQNGGDWNKALAAYGGFKTKDPSQYIADVSGGAKPGPMKVTINGSVPPPAAAAPTQRAAPIQQAVARAAAGGAPGDIAVLSGGPLNGGIDAFHERYDPASGVYQKVDPLGPITDVSRLSLIQRAVDAARTGQSQQAAQLQQILAPTISGEAQTNSAGIHATGNLLSTQEQGQTARDVEGQRGASAKEVARIGADANRFTPTQDTETTDPLTGRTTRQTSAGVFDRQSGTVTRPEKAKQPIGKAQWEAHVKKYKLTPEQQASYLRENNFVVQ